MLANSLPSRQGLTQPAMPSITKPQEFSPLPAQPPTWGVRARPSCWDSAGEDGAGVWAWHQCQGPRAPCAALAGPAGSGAGSAWRKRSRTCCTRPGMLREPHTCLAHAGSPCSLISPSQPCSLAAPAFSPRGCKQLGVAAHLPRAASRRSEGWARVSSPSLGG